MKKNEIKVGRCYVARVSGRMTTVRVTGVRECGGFDRNRTVYDVTNLATGRKLTFRSAMKLRKEATPPKPTNVVEVTGRVLAGETNLKVEEIGGAS